MKSLSPAARYRWQVVSRVLAAVFGGYALISATTVLLALIWPLPQAQALLASTMLSFALYTGVIIWVFAVKKSRTVWLWLIVLTVVSALLSGLLLPEIVLGAMVWH